MSPTLLNGKGNEEISVAFALPVDLVYAHMLRSADPPPEQILLRLQHVPRVLGHLSVELVAHLAFDGVFEDDDAVLEERIDGVIQVNGGQDAGLALLVREGDGDGGVAFDCDGHGEVFAGKRGE
jgi:hypothetical protein